MANRKKSKSQLLAELRKFKLHLDAEGYLNGTSDECRECLADAIDRGIDLTGFDVLQAILQPVEETEGGLLSKDAKENIQSKPHQVKPKPAPAKAKVRGKVDAPEIDIDEAKRHLRALGISHDKPLILCAYGSTNRFFPDRRGFLTAGQKSLSWEERNKIPFNWALFKKRHAQWTAEGRDRHWKAVRRELRNEQTPNLGFIGQAGGTRTKNNEITEMRFLTYEVDARSDGSKPTLDEQRKAWKLAGLPEPSLVVHTGGKSLHFYWRLKEAVPVAEGEIARKRLFHGIQNANPLLVCDRSMASGHQPQRLAGYVHPKTGNRSVVESDSGIAYDLAELLALLPELPEKELGKADGDGELFRDDGEKAKPGERLSLPVMGTNGQPMEVPLTIALSKTTQDLIKQGQAPGKVGGVGRCQKAHSLSRSFQAAEAQLEFLGQPFMGSAEELFQQFVVNSEIPEDYHRGDVDEAMTAYWNEDAHGEGELSELALRRAVNKWARDRKNRKSHDRFNQKQKQKQKQQPAPPSDPQPDEPDFKAAAKAVGAQWNKDGFVPRKGSQVKWGERHLSQGKRLDLLDRTILHCSKRLKNTFRRKAWIRAVATALKLKSQVRDQEISGKILEALDQHSGNVYEPLDAEARMAMEAPRVEWLITGLMPANDLTFIGGRAKVGKTRLAVGLIQALLAGDDFLGFHNPDAGRVVVFVSDDQSDGDTHDMLQAAGIWEHPRLIWSRRFRMNERNLDGLMGTIKDNPGAVVVFDSLRSITRSTGIDENSPEMGELLYDLKGVVLDNGGSLALVHHCSKSNEAVGMEALSGHNSIPGAGNTVLTMHYLPGRDGQPDKNNRERRLFREARSGQGFDLVVKANEQLRYENIETFEERRQKAGNEKASQELAKAICSDDEHMELALGELLRLFESGNCPGISLLDLCPVVGISSKAPEKISDLDKQQTQLYKSLYKKLEKMTSPQGKGEALLVTSKELDNNRARARVIYALTSRGAELVKEQLE